MVAANRREALGAHLDVLARARPDEPRVSAADPATVRRTLLGSESPAPAATTSPGDR